LRMSLHCNGCLGRSSDGDSWSVTGKKNGWSAAFSAQQLREIMSMLPSNICLFIGPCWVPVKTDWIHNWDRWNICF
jgi:hypothetical protein